MSGDSINSLPINNKNQARPGDLELIHNLFQPQNAQAIKSEIQRGISSFKLAFIGAVLFGILSFPIISKFLDIYTKNCIISKIVLMLIFMVVFFLVEKFLSK